MVLIKYSIQKDFPYFGPVQLESTPSPNLLLKLNSWIFVSAAKGQVDLDILFMNIFLALKKIYITPMQLNNQNWYNLKA